jgi:pimeloyl-ACP methyl ester carboxylesterase
VRVTLGDGRIVRYWSGGASPGPVVLFFHGCPDTRRIAMTGERAAHEAGVRLLCVNRPGYGASTATASTHTSVARDAAELLDLWDIERVAVLGMSVGGPYAAAFAATYPERAAALGLVSAPAMGETSEESVEAAMERMRSEFLAWRFEIDPDDEDDDALAGRFLAQLPAADAALLEPLGAEAVASMIWEAVVRPEGYLRDAALLFHEWDFDPVSVRCPVWAWVGDQDEKALAAAAWWTERLPQAEVEVLAGTSHLAALLTRWPTILQRLRAGLETATD